MDNGLLLMAEIITDYIRENEWLSEHDKMVLGTLRRDCVCKYSPVGAYKCYVAIKASQQSGYRDICLDTCLQDEVYKLQHKHGIRTIGCCCGHGVTTPYIQVSPEGDNIDKMYLLGYEPLPLDEHGHGHWCFKPKTYLDYCGGEDGGAGMSECVVRMEMPESCKRCKNPLCLWLNDDGDFIVDHTIAAVQDFRKKNDDGFPDFCPIVCQLPERHGRLVDAEEMYKKSEAFCNQCRQGEHDCEKCNYIVAQGYMYKSHAIVPATNTPTETPTNTPTATERSEI